MLIEYKHNLQLQKIKILLPPKNVLLELSEKEL